MSNEKCPIEETLKIVGRKWTLLIIRDLFRGKKRFSDFQRSLSGISPKTLSQELKKLEQDGIITRKIFPERPPRVEYYLTRMGKELKPIVESIEVFGNKFLL